MPLAGSEPTGGTHEDQAPPAPAGTDSPPIPGLPAPPPGQSPALMRTTSAPRAAKLMVSVFWAALVGVFVYIMYSGLVQGQVRAIIPFILVMALLLFFWHGTALVDRYLVAGQDWLKYSSGKRWVKMDDLVKVGKPSLGTSGWTIQLRDASGRWLVVSCTKDLYENPQLHNLVLEAIQRSRDRHPDLTINDRTVAVLRGQMRVGGSRRLSTAQRRTPPDQGL